MRAVIALMGALFLMCSLSTAVFAQAQKETGEFHGTVYDLTNTVVPKAQVLATDTATGITKATVSGTDGPYLTPTLLDGNYTVAVVASGFDTLVYSGVVVYAGCITEMPLSLKLGTVTDTVQVAAAATPLETSSNQVANTLHSDAIIDLPLAARDTLVFASLSAGYTANNGTCNGLFEAASDISLDAATVNDHRNKSGSGFLSLVPLRLDAVGQVTITTSGRQAEEGAGGVKTIQFTTRRGANQYHGSPFEQFQNTDLDANAFFNNQPDIVTRLTGAME